MIIAGGHYEYGRMAANLAMTIKSQCNEKIHLAWHGQALSTIADYMIFFDSVSEIPNEYLEVRGKINYFKAKTHIYDLSPFEETLFLDADIAMMRPASQLMDSLKDVEWTIQNRSFINLSDDKKEKYFWANIAEVKQKYQGRLYSLHSECVWFKRSEENKIYFEKVKEIYDNPPVNPTKFNGDVADELAFGLACNILNKNPHVTPFVPVYWFNLDSKNGINTWSLREQYYGYSAGGNRWKQFVTDEYNKVCKGAAAELGLKAFPLVQKIKYCPERKHM